MALTLRPDDPGLDEPATHQPGAPGVGAVLQAMRERHGRELAEIAAVLRIRAVFLDAIEQGRYDELPGVPYALGFVRPVRSETGGRPSELWDVNPALAAA